jgi:hypothetical protein
MGYAFLCAMPLQDYYLAREKIDTKGLQFYLKQLQVKDSSGGGRALLGSIVDYIDEVGEYTYVVPASLTTPQILLKELEKRRDEYGIDGPVSLMREIAPGTETMKLQKKNTFQLGVGPFPAMPFNFGFSVDYARMDSISMVHGEGSYYEYIPMGYLAKIYERVKGRPTAELGGKLLLKEGVIVEILLAKNYTVTFASTEKLGSHFEAKMKAFNALPDVAGKVILQSTGAKTVTAKIKGETSYLVALFSALWSDIARATT